MKKLIAVLAAAGAAAGLAVAVPASASGPSKPAWLHVGHVRHYRDCHGAGVIVWQSPRPGVNGTSALHCRNGKTFLS
jgi:hypothetical protein